MHALQYGLQKQLPLEGAASVSGAHGSVTWAYATFHLHSFATDAVAKVRAYIESDPAILNNRSAFVEGWGWDTTKWPVERWPTAARYQAFCPTRLGSLLSSQAELEADPVTRGRPIALRSKDAHGYWVSQMILDAMAPIPEKVDGGVIVRDSRGEPIGETTSEMSQDALSD